MLTRNWLDALRKTFSHREARNRGRRNRFYSAATEGLEDRTLLYAPYSANDSYSAIAGQTLTVGTSTGVLANDMDMDGDPLTAQLMTSAYSGTDTFNYTISDGMLTATATTSLTVHSIDCHDCNCETTFVGGQCAVHNRRHHR